MVAVAALIVAAGWVAWRAFRAPPIPLAVVARGWAARRRWRRILGDGVRRLQRLVPPPTGADLALVVAAWLPEGRQAATIAFPRCGDGRAAYVVRLALTVEGRPLVADEVLAALAEQYLACALAPRSRAARPATMPPAAAADPLRALLGEMGVDPDGAPGGASSGAAAPISNLAECPVRVAECVERSSPCPSPSSCAASPSWPSTSRSTSCRPPLPPPLTAPGK